ncbi:MAG: hypothetical protein IPO09_14965 [Anaeromyxobacter sp.]|nr:hypothetical protein [Anaeromyxobacter sp.]MBL0277106.1 hypothetical protein [Anaeromyxobacter sp.]
MTKGKLGAKSVSACALLLLSACGGGGGSSTPTPPPDGTGTVGTAGGTVTLSTGAAVTIPGGALAGDRAITVAADGTNGPSGNPRYRFGPAGTTFSSPVTVTLPKPAGLAVGATAAVYWTKPGSENSYDALPATVTASGVTAQVTHFSLGFVGAACTEGATCAEGLAACQAGAMACASGAPVCAASGPVADGTACGAATACVAVSTCQAGSCVVGAPVSCDDGNACTADACDGVSGCSHANVADGTACGGGACSAGSCTADAFDSTALGATMTYQVTPPTGAAYRTTFEVVATSGATFTRKVTRPDQPGYSLNDLVRIGTGAYVVQSQSLAANGTVLSTVTYSPPLLFYPATLTPGAVETRTSTLGGSGTGNSVVTVTVAAPEPVVTTLGSFQAFKLTTTNSSGGSTLVSWWAPGVGRVKWQTSVSAAPTQVTTYELVAFGGASATCPAQGSVCAGGQVCLATGCGPACELTSCAPTALPDQAVARNGAPVLIDVLANDSAPRGSLDLVSATTPTSGSVAVVAGKLQFTPPSAGATGTASFSYTASDGAQSATATVTVTMAQTLTVTGQVAGVSLPGGRAGLWYGQTQAEGTLNASGTYTATLDVVDRSAVVFGTAVGDPASGQGSVMLLSVLGSFDALGHGQHGPLVITEAETTSVTLSPLSLARYGAVGQANGFAIPTTDLQIVEAEQVVSSTQLLDIAAAVKVSIDQPTLYPPPAGQDWLFLATDPAVLKSYQAQVAAAAGSTAPLDEARAALLADPQVVPAFTVPSGGGAYHATYAPTPGYFPRGGDLLELAADGTGSYLDVGALHPLTWQVVQGVLTADITQAPITFTSFQPVASLPLSAEVRAAYAPATQVQQTDTITTLRFQPVLMGTRQLWAEQTYAGTTTWPPVLVGGATVAPSAPYDFTYQSLLREERLNPAIPFTAALATGVWATNAYYSAGVSGPSLAPLAARINGDLLTLAADGSGSSAKSGRALTWTITTGDLKVTYADGAQQIVRILAERAGFYSVFSVHLEPGGAMHGGLDLAFKKDPGLSLAGAAVATNPGEYWVNQINNDIPELWVDGQLPSLYWFGWELYADGSGLNLFGDTNGDGTVDRATEAGAVTWSVLGEVIEVVRFPAAGDPRRALRRWQPVWISADGTTFCALEEELRRSPATNPYGFFIEPRLTYFERWPSP